jgi:hypothetical protein
MWRCVDWQVFTDDPEERVTSSSEQKVTVLHSSEMLVYIYQTARAHVFENNTVNRISGLLDTSYYSDSVTNICIEHLLI